MNRRPLEILCAVLLVPALLCVAPSQGEARSRRDGVKPLAVQRLHARDRNEGGLPVVRFARARLREARGRRDRFEVKGFPLRRDLEVDLELEAFTVTRSDTRFVLGRKGAPDIPLAFDPSDVTLLRGSVAGRPGSRVVLALRRGGHTGSIDLGPGHPRYWISSKGRRGESLEPEQATVFEASGAPELPPEVPFCGTEGHEFGDATAPLAPASSAAAATPAVGLQHVELAVDTDHEFFQLFGDATEAAAYLVAMYGQVSDIYLRDVDTRVELVFARIWDQPDDLFNDVDPSPLSDFQSHWQANMGGVQRDVAQLLSGRRNYPFGGQAFLSAMCGGSAYGVVGYATGFFPDPSQPSPFHYDISVTAHELGHNAGTGHTHDAANNIDTCDDPLSTPQRGTIMSYCSQTWSGGNTNRDLYLHSVVQQNIDAHFAGSACVVDDCNLNGIADASDISGGGSLDTNGNGVPDECEDCDDNGTLDPQDIVLGAADVDGDGVPDVCEPDCNTNGVPDDHDIVLGTSTDAYGNDVPDECEADCDTDSISDYTEIQIDMTLDVDRSATLDSCQDCDTDGTPDLVELAGAHGMWLASGLTGEPIRRFHPATGVLAATSSGGAGALLDEAQDVLIVGTRVLVSSAGDHRVAEFTLGGSYVGDLVAASAGGLTHPTGLALAPGGDLLVASHDTDQVLAYDVTSGTSLGAFVSAGAGGLTGPFGVAVGPNGNVFVTRDDGGVNEYDGSTGASLGTFVDPLQNGGLTSPRDLLFKPDRNLLVTSYGTDETLEYQRDTGFPLGRWAKSGNVGGTRLTQESPWGLGIGPSGNVFIVRTGEAFGSSGGGGEHEHEEEASAGTGALHLTNAQIYEFDVRNGNFLRAHVNGNDHGVEFPTGFDYVPGYALDCNVSGVQDSCDIASGASLDLDTNGTPDECELDCNTNGTLDRLDIIPFGTSSDCNDNLIPDECDTATAVGGACEPANELSCGDGFDNDRDGFGDCFDTDCDGLPACSEAIQVGEGFALDAGSFVYVDDPFRATGAPAYASGAHGANGGFEGGGGLSVSLGGIDGADILGMSGGWQLDFNLAVPGGVTLAARYRMEQEGTYESDEFSQVLVSIDGALVGTMGNDYVVQLTGNGQGDSEGTRFAGWTVVELDLGSLAAGPHTLVIGGYNNKKTLADESTAIFLDDVALIGPPAPVCGDGNLDAGEDCDDGNTLGGDCCSATCGFETLGSSCEDGSLCTELDACDGAGVCVPGAPPDCDDAEVCTDDSCDPGQGCVNTPNSDPCDDGDLCTNGDVCSAGSCQAGPPLDCNDLEICTDDSCNPGLGCVNAANSDPCDDGDLCSENDVCSAGSCQAGPPLDCDDAEVCTDDSCDPGLGCMNAPNTDSCDDGNLCTDGDVCAGGSCDAGPPLDCDDGDACTADSCDQLTGCGHDPIPGCGAQVPLLPFPLLPWLAAGLVVSAAALGVPAAARRARRRAPPNA